jgi:hypothetical protein
MILLLQTVGGKMPNLLRVLTIVQSSGYGKTFACKELGKLCPTLYKRRLCRTRETLSKTFDMQPFTFFVLELLDVEDCIEFSRT